MYRILVLHFIFVMDLFKSYSKQLAQKFEQTANEASKFLNETVKTSENKSKTSFSYYLYY